MKVSDLTGDLRTIAEYLELPEDTEVVRNADGNLSFKGVGCVVHGKEGHHENGVCLFCGQPVSKPYKPVREE